MMRIAMKNILAGVLLLSGSAGSANDQQIIDDLSPVSSLVGEVAFRECIVESQGRDRTVECAWFEVPENYAEPDGEKIKLFIARLPASKPKKFLQPMLFLAGGPGQSAAESYLHIDRVHKGLAKDRDFYLIDQRGTGRSNYLGCSDLIEERLALMNQYDPNLLEDLTQSCLQVMPGDPRFYTTSVAVKDFERVREALDVKQWNLYGVSYGTRSGMHYMRKYPDAIRTAVLDSLVPPELPLFADIAENSQKMLSMIYQRCEQDVECNKRFPSLSNDVNALIVRLKKSPISVKVENFVSGELEDFKLSVVHLRVLIRLYLYHTNTLAFLPPVLNEAAAKNNFAPLVRAYINMTEMMDGVMSPGMHNAVICTEDFPFYTIDDAMLDRDDKTYLGTDLLESLQATCKNWPKGEMDKDLKEAMNSSIPTLLFSGEHDPITPPDYGEQVLRGLSNARHFVLQGQGHFVSVEGCAPNLVEDFIDDANPEKLNADCLQRLDASPLFMNFNGPLP